jgi:cation/acetate symporter
MANGSGSGDFEGNLGKVYAIYTSGFAAFVILMAILEQIGVPERVIGYLFVIFTLALYAAIGLMARTMQISEYYVAGRRVPAFYNGVAASANWISGAAFVALAGWLYVFGYDGLAFVLGWSGGYVLIAVLIAPYLRKYGAYTVPDFLAARFGGNLARLMGVVVLLSCSFVFLTAQLHWTGIVVSRFLGLNFQAAVFIGLIGILLCSALGGMRAVTWTQVAQYVVLFAAYLIPVVILSAQNYGIPIPQLTYGNALREIAALESNMVSRGLAEASRLRPHLAPFTDFDPVNFFLLVLCLMVGTASLPHLLMRYVTTPSVREARKSVGWSLLFVLLIFFTAPAYAAFAKLEVYQSVIGASLDALPDWLYAYGRIGLMKVCDADATAVEAIKAACAAQGNTDGLLHLRDLAIDPDVIVISMPEIAGLPYVVAGLVAAGGLAAALSTADGLLIAVANTLSHDVYYKMADPAASTARRLVVGRVLVIAVAGGAAWLAATDPQDILSTVAWAFSLAAAGNFPALVLGIWWKRCTSQGAVAGMLAGFSVSLFYLVATQYGGMDEWFGVKNISAAIFGLPVGFLTIYAVSRIAPEPSREMQDFIDEIRTPRGETVVDAARETARG